MTESILLKYILPVLLVLANALLVALNLLKGKEQKKKIEATIENTQGQYRYNPNPPGEAQACKDHKLALSKLGEKIEEQGTAIARVEENQGAQEKRLDWIQGKLNGK